MIISTTNTINKNTISNNLPGIAVFWWVENIYKTRSQLYQATMQVR